MKSRDMHWALVAHRDQRDVNLSSLRMLVVADGSNPCKNCQSQHCRLLPSKCTLTDKTQGSNKPDGPCLLLPASPSGSISSCDAFLNVFQSKGLKSEVICPCASSPEALTVAIRR